MEEELISVIVPVFNVEQYLPRCIDSIINQTYNNLEIILIDDGSTDNSGKICDEYEKKDKRIKTFHKKNGGLSDARNYGLNRMNGKYVSFVDSDDYIDKSFLKVLYSNLKTNKSEISCCKMMNIKTKIKKNKKNVKKTIIKVNSSEAIKMVLYENNIDSSVCNKIFDKELFDNINFPIGRYFEDLSTIYKIIYKSTNVVITNLPLYFYFQRHDSIVHTKNEKRIYDLKICLQELEEFVKKNPIYKQSYLNRKISALFYIYRESNNSETKKWSKNEIKKYRRKVLYDKKSSKKNKIGIIISYISFNLVNYLYKLRDKVF